MDTLAILKLVAAILAAAPPLIKEIAGVVEASKTLIDAFPVGHVQHEEAKAALITAAAATSK